MEIHNEQKNKHIKFKKKVIILITLGDKVDKLFSEGKINKKKKKEIKEIISLKWDAAYNKHPYVSQSIKQGFNLLYT